MPKVRTRALRSLASKFQSSIITAALTESADYIDELELEIKQLKMDQYKYQCSGCGEFEKTLSRTCPNCGRQNYLTGSFLKEDLETWMEKNAINNTP